MSYYSRHESKRETLGGVAFVVVFVGAILLIVSAIGLVPKTFNRITDDIALEHFRRQAQTDNVEIVTKTNDDLIFGNTQDVTYELLIDGKPSAGRCTSGATSPIVCRIYGPGGGE